MLWLSIQLIQNLLNCIPDDTIVMTLTTCNQSKHWLEAIFWEMSALRETINKLITVNKGVQFILLELFFAWCLHEAAFSPSNCSENILAMHSQLSGEYHLTCTPPYIFSAKLFIKVCCLIYSNSLVLIQTLSSGTISGHDCIWQYMVRWNEVMLTSTWTMTLSKYCLVTDVCVVTQS